MQYLFVACGGLAIFIVTLLVGKKNKSVSDYTLLVWLLLFVVNFVVLFMLQQPTLPFSVGELLILEFSEVSIFAHGPIFLLYTLSLSSENFQLKRVHLLHLLPFVFGYLFFLVYILTYQEIDSFTRNMITLLKMGSLLTYLIFVILRLRKHRTNVERIFSNVEKKYLNWLTFLSWGILIIWVIASSSLLIDRFTDITIPHYSGLLTNLAMCVFVFLMGYFGLNQPLIFVDQRLVSPVSTSKQESGSNPMAMDDSKYRKSGLDEKQSSEIQGRLLELMHTEMPYLQKELNLYSLSELLQVQPNHLSQVINSLEGQNFFDFINMHRVTAAKEKIGSQQFENLTLLGIAFECGFNSKASFNRAFKKFTGLTPTDFKKQSASSN
jgi:AraC-like DNA-binding protein